MARKRSKQSSRLPEKVSTALKYARYSSQLVLADCGLTRIPEEVFTIKRLTYIDLSGNGLRNIPQKLWNLPKLQKVNLLRNPIESLPNRPGMIIDVPTYLRCYTQVLASSIHLFLEIDTRQEDVELLILELKKSRSPRVLQIGRFGGVSITPESPPSPALLRIIDSFSLLKGVESLSLRGFKLAAVPKGICEIEGITDLHLVALGLQELPDWIGLLKLQSLNLAANRLSNLPESINELAQLKRLDLAINTFTKIPAPVFDLPSLEQLRLDQCNVSEVPADILRLPRLKRLRLLNNPIESPPKEVTDKGLDAIRDYWRQRADTGVDYLCEAKLIILGEAGAGKTSLARKIEDPNYKLQDEKSTEGIDVIRYEFPTTLRPAENAGAKNLQRQFQVNIWDFGGQEIYRSTHQFFLTRRSVYVLVCDDRKEDTDFFYWLQIVEMLSDGSPLLIVQNEKQDRTRDINLSNLRARFTNLREAIPANLDTNRGLARVIQSIQKELENLPHVGVGLPATWKRVREALEKDERDYISLEEYLAICQQHGFTRREDKLQLSGYLHDLGICLHFQDDALLKNTVVLKPTWGTDAVYRVLDDPEVIANRGRFTRSQLERIWSEEKYSGMQDELLRLMMKFQLCYELETKQAYIAPQLLSSEQPTYKWDTIGGLVVRYEYAFLPKGIVTRFIVAMHRLIAGEDLVWKTGVVLEKHNTRAEVIEEYSQRRIRVRVSGPDPHSLFAIIDEQLERLHASFPRLQYERYLPCPCDECQQKAEPYGFPLSNLIKMSMKNHQIQCHESGDMVDAARLLWAILPGVLLEQGWDVEFPTPWEKALALSAEPTREVFVSYAWTEESNAIVDRIQQALQEHHLRLLRDREEVRYKDSIREFMRRIGQGKAVIVVISEKFLKSENCMFEMVEIAKAQSLRERVFPIVLSDANIYKATGRIRYVSYWENEIRELDEALKTVRADNLTKLHDDLNLYSEIRRLFDGIAGTLRDMNALTPDQHEGSGFDELIRRVRAQLGT